MCSFINLEAKEKADEIANDVIYTHYLQTKEKCALEKQKIVDKARKDIDREFALLVKRIDTEKRMYCAQ